MITHLLKLKQDKAASYYAKLEGFLKNNNKEKGINQAATFEEFMLTLTVALVFVDSKTWKQEFKQAFFYYMLSTGSNIVKGKSSLEPPKHNIKSRQIRS